MAQHACRVPWVAGKVNVTFDGNSLADAAYSTLCTQISARRPLLGIATINNKAINGQTVAMMTSNATDVDNTWVAGSVNILIAWEITNSIFVENKTGLAACSELAAYIAARKAVRPWLVVVPTCLPRGDHLGSHYTATTGEVELLAANNYLKNNYRGMGIHRLVDIRQGPFSFTDPTNAANFPSSLWVDKTHPNTAGHAYTAGYIADALVNLRPRN